MSRTQCGHVRKPLDVFFWLNEVTGEVTYPLLKVEAPAASPESPGERPRSQCVRAVGPPAAPALGAAPLSPLEASLSHQGFRNSLVCPPPPGLRKARPWSPPPFTASPSSLSPPGLALPASHPVDPALGLPACTFPPSPSAPWDFTCKLKNALTGNNRFSF
ncbi:uncharacterized protein C3orf86-like [Erinaceus europaeus]|uniref:Uncharacterized protein C3orf86-like n=1 Tax=Erinaceus europaeus TaxID=9365 RepID=A0ABM3YIB4_ERIEU|nr:uncharacterized protein C3orf86-like [Erinaceus europaeus]